MKEYGSRAWRSRALCVCGCERRAVQQHHVVPVQDLKRYAGTKRRAGPTLQALRSDKRNLVPVASGCHYAHHNASVPFPLRVLPDSAFEFAEEVMGSGPAFEFFRRRYAGDDVRLDQLLEEADHGV